MRFGKYIKEAVKLASIPASMNLGRPLSPPSVAAFYLTSRCNSRCSMCGFWKNDFDPGEELGTEEWIKVLDDLHDMGVPFVSLGAEGEIFTRKDVLRIFHRARQLGFDYTINTNGLYLPDRFVDQVHKLAPHGIIFGLDTDDPERYARIRGIPNGLDRVLGSIRKLKQVGYNGISIGAVVLNDNLEKLIGLADMALRERVKALRFTAFSPVGFGTEWDKKSLEIYSNPNFLTRLQQVLEKLIQHKKQHGIISNSEIYIKGIPEYYRRGFQHLPIPCAIGYYNLQILPNGDVPVCAFRGKSGIVGNVRKTSIKEIFWSKAYQNERDKINKGLCPTCWMSCYAENNLRFYPKTMIQANASAFTRSLRPNI